MKTIELNAVGGDFPAICQAVANTGQAVVITQAAEPLVSVVPTPRLTDAPPASTWELRRQYEASHGVLTDDFELPPRELAAPRREDPLGD